MIQSALEVELHNELERLPPAKQRDVLNYAKSLGALPRIGVPGATYFPWTDSFDSEDLAEMKRAIEEECERIDVDGW